MMSSWMAFETEERDDFQLPEDGSTSTAVDDDLFYDTEMLMHTSDSCIQYRRRLSNKGPGGKATTDCQEPSESRRIIRKSIGEVFATPVRTVKEKLSSSSSASSPMMVIENLRRSMRKKGNGEPAKPWWLDELDLPQGTSSEEAFAVLLCRELEAIDI